MPDGLAAMELTLADLPDDWRSYPAPAELQVLGDEWIRAARSAVLHVPSAVIPRERNVLLNRLHPEFAKVRIDPPDPLEFDPRLGWKK